MNQAMERENKIHELRVMMATKGFVSNRMLANEMKVSEQYISNIMKGPERLDKLIKFVEGYIK